MLPISCLDQKTATQAVCIHTTLHPAMSSSSVSVPTKQYSKQVALGTNIILTEGAIQPGNCADVAAAAAAACRVMGKSAWTKKNSKTGNGSRSLHIRCFSEKPKEKGGKSPGVCTFKINTIEGDKNTPPGQVRIVKFVSHHGCREGNCRKRAVSLSVLKAQSETLGSFVPVTGRSGGNMAQLQTMVQQKDGIAMKKGQVYNALKEKTGTLCTHLASYRMLHGWIAYMTKKDPGGTYVIEADWLDGNAHFSYLFAAPSATKKVHGYHIVSLPTDDPFAYLPHAKHPRGHTFVLDYGLLGDVPPGVHLIDDYIFTVESSPWSLCPRGYMLNLH